MFGNLAIMRILVHGVHVPLLAANLAAILSCSMINFFLGHRWVFKQGMEAL
jgi:putative flippase GtrA